MDTAYGRRWIRCIGNCEYAFSCEDLALIRLISFPRYGVLVRMGPSHEGYRNTIELPDGNNVVPLRSDTIRLVQNGCSFHGLRSEDPNQHLKDFLKLVDSLDLDVANRERTHMRLFQFSLCDQPRNWLERLLAGSITTWEDLTTRFLAQFFPSGRTSKLQNDILMFQQHQGESLSEAWTRFKDLLQKVPHHGIDLLLQKRTGPLSTIEELARYEDEGWNDPIFPEERSLNYKNSNIEQLLGIMEYQVDMHMKNAILPMGKGENLCGLSSNTMRQLPPEPSHDEAVEGLVMNFILEQEEKVRQLEEYMCIIGSDFMYPDTEDLDPLKGHEFSESLAEKASFCTPKSISPKSLFVRYVHTVFPSPPLVRKSTFGFKPGKKGIKRAQGDNLLALKNLQRNKGVIDWSFLANHGLDRSFFDSINTNNFSGPQWVNLFQINELVYRELVHEFFASIEFESTVYRYEPEHLGGSYYEGRAFVDGILVNNRDDEFVVGGTSVKKVRDLRVKLADHCIVTTISGPKGVHPKDHQDRSLLPLLHLR
ncbi:zinc finger, CCHC-type containing protein [Tanacetum coccineum]